MCVVLVTASSCKRACLCKTHLDTMSSLIGLSAAPPASIHFDSAELVLDAARQRRIAEQETASQRERNGRYPAPDGQRAVRGGAAARCERCGRGRVRLPLLKLAR